MNNHPIPFDEVRQLFQSGELSEKPNEYLDRCSRGLAAHAITNPYIQHHATIIAEAIQHILLARLLEEQEKRNAQQEKYNRIMTKWFLVVAIVSLISSFVQIAIGLWSNLPLDQQSQANTSPASTVEAVSILSTNQP